MFSCWGLGRPTSAFGSRRCFYLFPSSSHAILFLPPRANPWRSCPSSTSVVPTTPPGRTISETFTSRPCSTCHAGTCSRPRVTTTTSGSPWRTAIWPTSAPTSRRPSTLSVGPSELVSPYRTDVNSLKSRRWAAKLREGGSPRQIFWLFSERRTGLPNIVPFILVSNKPHLWPAPFVNRAL